MIIGTSRRPTKSTPLALLRFLLMAGLASSLACGSGSDGDAGSEPPAPATSAEPPPAPAPSQNAPGASGVPPEAAAAVAEAFGMAADQLRAACGPIFDTCSATPGCNEILACAARSACSGSACYCADASCQTAGPCQAVIDGAPGARQPDAANPSLGPAPDAATAVGACLQGLGGGGLPPGPVPAPPPAPASDGDAGAPGGEADAG